MTCFWTSIFSKIMLEKFPDSIKKPKNIKEFILLLKNNNRETQNITINGKILTKNEMLENMLWIRDYDIALIHNGHYTSTSDPFLALIAELFELNINHEYIGQLSTYKFNSIIKYRCKKAKKIIRFGSNTGHFYNK